MRLFHSVFWFKGFLIEWISLKFFEIECYIQKNLPSSILKAIMLDFGNTEKNARWHHHPNNSSIISAQITPLLKPILSAH